MVQSIPGLVCQSGIPPDLWFMLAGYGLLSLIKDFAPFFIRRKEKQGP